jgi:Tfp pilus assembly protein PilF
MVTARQIKSCQPLLLLAVLALTTCLFERDACRAQEIRSVSTKNSARQQAAQFVNEGVAAFERGDATTARDSFQKALRLNPGEVTAHTYLGVIADGAGDLREAERHFSAAAMAAPSLASARNNYGGILMRMGRHKLAAAQFEASLKLERDQPSALVNLAQIRFASGASADLAAAADLFARAYAIKPDAEVARALTVIALRRHDNASAQTRYRAYAARLAAESGTPAHAAPARAELGAALFEAGLWQEAADELTAVINLNPADAESVVRLARVHLARKDIPAAGRTLEAAVARGVEAAPVYALLADVYEQSGHLENAIPALRLAIQHDPQSEKYRFAYAMLLTNAYAPAAAIIRLEEALKAFPDSPRLWFALGLANFKLDKDEEAAQALNRAIALDAKFAPAFAYLGMMKVKKGAYNEGIALYENALRVDPKLAVAHYLIADAMLKQVETDAARVESHLKRTVEMDATFIQARLALARLYMRAERWADAAAELEQVIRFDPNVADAYYQLGRAYIRLKRNADSQTALATFKRLSETQKAQENNDLREVVKRLGQVRF